MTLDMRTRMVPPSPRSRRRVAPLIAAATALLATTGAGLVAYRALASGDPGLRYERLDDPARTVVRDESGVLAVLTDGARTMVFRGPGRTLAEPSNTAATVSTLAVVRLAPRPWRPGDERSDWFRRWFATAVTATDPDLIDVALQYGPAAPERRDAKQVRYAGHATFGPLESGVRTESSDFNDYLGVDWKFPDGTRRAAKRAHYGALDCSGFVRVVYGYRSGYPLEFSPRTGEALPRRAVTMAERAGGFRSARRL